MANVQVTIGTGTYLKAEGAGTVGDPHIPSQNANLQVGDTDVSASNPVPIEGEVAHNAADSGSPVKIGGKGNASAPTAADEGDRVDASFDLQGRLRVTNEAALSHTTDSVQLGDGTDLAGVTAAGALQVDGSGVTQPVSAASLPLPTGAATAANQLPDGHNVTVDNAAGASAVNIQDGGNSITVDGTVTADAGTGFAPVVTDGAAAGTTGTHVLGTDGTNAQIISTNVSGHVNIADGGNIITVDGTVTADAGTGPWPVTDNAGSLTVDAPTATPVPTAITTTTDTLVKPGDSTNNAMRVNVVAGSAGGTEFNEDAASSGGEAGTLALGYRQDADTSPVTADGDFHGLIFDSLGNLKVNVKQGAAGGVTHTDDAAFTAGTDDIVPAGGVYQATADLVDDGDAGAVRMTQRRAMYVSHETPAGDSMVDDTNDALQVNVVAGSAGGTEYVEGATDATITGTALMMEDAADTLRAATGDVTNGLDVDVTRVQGTVTVDGSGVTQPVSGTITANAGTGTFTVDGSGVTQPVSGTITADAGTGTFTSGGDVAHNAADSGNPVKIGGKGNAAAPTAADEGDRVDASFDLQGRLRVDGSGVTQPVSGTITANAGTGTFTVDGSGVTQPVSGTITANAGTGTFTVDGSAVTQPVSGTITANAGTGDFLSITGHTTNEAFKEATAIGGQLDDTTTTAATEDNVAPVRITAQRAIHSNLRNNAGTEIGVAAAPIRTDPTGSTTQPVSGTVTANAGTGTRTVAGGAADDVAVSGNPVQIGMVARTTDPTAVAAGDVAYPMIDTLRKVVTRPYCTHSRITQGTQTLTGTGDVALLAAQGAGTRIYVTSITASNTSGTATRVDFKDGTTTRISFYLAASGGGASHTMPVPLRIGDNTAFNAALGTGVTDVRVSFQGYLATN